jgi:branched-chain amino acid transport system substrate-binding protein
MRHLAIGAAFAAAASLALAMTGGAAAQEKPVKVGVIFPQSGGAGPQGQHVAQAIRAMAETINEGGGVLGRKIEIVLRDDESTPAVGVAKANELIAEGVSVIIEGWNSPVTLAMQPVIARAGILDITAISKADGILAGNANPLAIRLNSSNSQDGAVIAKHLAGKKYARIAFLTQNDAYGNGAQESIEKELKALGHTYQVASVQQFPFAQTDFRVALTTIKSANPDVVVAINANEGSGLPALIRQYEQVRIEAPFVATVGTIAPSVIEVAGPAANGVVSADIYFPDVEPFKSNAANQRFVDRVKSMFNLMPDKYMALGAASLEVWAKAATQTKSLEKEPIAKAIRGKKIEGTILGDAAFAENGQLQSRHFLFAVKEGKIVTE